MVNEETHVKNGVSLTGGAAAGHAASNGQGGTGVGGQPGSESSEDEREGLSLRDIYYAYFLITVG